MYRRPKSGLYLQYDQKALGLDGYGKEKSHVFGPITTRKTNAVKDFPIKERGDTLHFNLWRFHGNHPTNGKTERREIGYGGGILTQASRVFCVREDTVQGNQRMTFRKKDKNY